MIHDKDGFPLIEYFDYNASTPTDTEVAGHMWYAMKVAIGNADSRPHTHGTDARELVEKARGYLAELVGVERNEVVFTSGATESSNTVIFGLRDYGLEQGKTHIITSVIEHKATLEPLKRLEKLGFKVDYIKPDKSGRVNAADIISKITAQTLLVTLQHVNNETGIIQPVEEVGAYCKANKVLFHIDAAQSLGKLSLKGIDYDMMSLSAHKTYGPQGVGALILRRKDYKRPPVQPLLYGGGQEGGMRSGTLAVPLIAGFGKACELAIANQEAWNAHSKSIKDEIIKALKKSDINFVINGDPKYCVPSTLNVSFIGVNSEALLLALKNYCSLANGSACTSKDYSHSYVLQAMELPQDVVESAIRMSWGKDSEKNPIDKIIETVKAIV